LLRKTKVVTKPKTDWIAVKTEYITTRMSYRELADKWSVSFRTLADRAKRENWTGEREAYRNKTVSKTVQKLADIAGADYARKLLKLQTAADNMGEVIAEIFEDTEQFRRHIVTQVSSGGKMRVECKKMKKVDTKAIKDITGALKDMALTMRNLYDMPTVQEKSAIEIAAERLALEKAKVDAGIKDDETGVVEVTPVVGGDKDNA
jgi:uncharacterized protein YjcR